MIQIQGGSNSYIKPHLEGGILDIGVNTACCDCRYNILLLKLLRLWLDQSAFNFLKILAGQFSSTVLSIRLPSRLSHSSTWLHHSTYFLGFTCTIFQNVTTELSCHLVLLSLFSFRLISPKEIASISRSISREHLRKILRWRLVCGNSSPSNSHC